jgi:hypothetical protein
MNKILDEFRKHQNRCRIRYKPGSIQEVYENTHNSPLRAYTAAMAACFTFHGIFTQEMICEYTLFAKPRRTS